MRHVRWQHSRSNRRLFLYNGESITTVISFVKVRMNYAVLVSLFHNEHVWPACFPILGGLIFTCVCWVGSYSLVLRERERERERGTYHTFISQQSFLFLFFKIYIYIFFLGTFHHPSISSPYMVDTYRWRRQNIEH